MDASRFVKERRPGTWRTATGAIMNIQDMSDSHLRNALAMMRRLGFISPETLSFYLSCPGPGGDMAQLAFEQELDIVMSSKVSAAMGDLEVEFERRGLKE